MFPGGAVAEFLLVDGGFAPDFGGDEEGVGGELVGVFCPGDEAFGVFLGGECLDLGAPVEIGVVGVGEPD